VPTIEESIVITRPVDEVFAYATDPANVATWQSNIVEYEQETDGDRDIGARDRGTVRVAGKKMAFTQEVNAWDPPKTATMKSLEAPMSWELSFRFEPLGSDRTRVTIHQEVGEMGGFFGKLGDVMATKMYTRDVRSNLENLKLVLEA
jgi:uncharacterized protein YndB with AHSA1/START domain